MTHLMSIYSISSSDTHSFFVYYFPGYNTISLEWMNNWVYENMNLIAQSFGSKGMIISPFPGENWKDLPGWVVKIRATSERGMGPPFLLISKRPLKPNEGENEESIGVNLEGCKNSNELSQIFELIITGIRTDDWQYIVKHFPMQQSSEIKSPDRSGLIVTNSVIELKPNLFGIGVNFNEVLRLIGNRYFNKD